jgi:predicted nucleotidyltransferase
VNLSQETANQIINILKKDEKVQKIILFGSRAKGTAKSGSDIDLAIVGENINFRDLCRFGVQLDDLDLPYQIDLVDYNTITNPELKSHIDRVGITLI